MPAEGFCENPAHTPSGRSSTRKAAAPPKLADGVTTAVRVTTPPVFNFFPSLVTTKVNPPLPVGIVVVVVVVVVFAAVELVEVPADELPATVVVAPGARTVSVKPTNLVVVPATAMTRSGYSPGTIKLDALSRTSEPPVVGFGVPVAVIPVGRSTKNKSMGRGTPRGNTNTSIAVVEPMFTTARGDGICRSNSNVVVVGAPVVGVLVEVAGVGGVVGTVVGAIVVVISAAVSATVVGAAVADRGAVAAGTADGRMTLRGFVVIGVSAWSFAGFFAALFADFLSGPLAAGLTRFLTDALAALFGGVLLAFLEADFDAASEGDDAANESALMAAISEVATVTMRARWCRFSCCNCILSFASQTRLSGLRVI